MTIIVMRRYGGHYKVGGSPVNVPTTLDQVINMSPHMPNQLQLYPIKLKQKLEYKSHYMYDVICKDCIIAALKWVKEHNNHYKYIEINENWHTMISDDGLSHILIHDDDTNAIANSDNSSRTMQQKNNESKEDYPHTCDKEPQTHDLYRFHTHESHKSKEKILHSNQNADDLDTHSSGSDPELAEDQAALDQKQELTGDVMPSVIQMDNMENCIYQCAPGKNNIPKYVLLDNDFEVVAFPDLFPSGSGAYNSEEICAKLPICKYFQQ